MGARRATERLNDALNCLNDDEENERVLKRQKERSECRWMADQLSAISRGVDATPESEQSQARPIQSSAGFVAAQIFVVHL